MAAPFHFDRTWRFDVPVEELWARLSHTEEFPHWWSWLTSFDAPEGLVDGAVANAVIRAPLPYVLRLQIAVEHVVAGALVDTIVDGDLRGPASLHLAPVAHGSEARLCWDLELANGMLRAASVVGRPIMKWAHDRVVATGVDQFRDQALG